MRKIWVIKGGASNEFFDSLFEFPKPIVQLFFNRGLHDKESISKFLNPSMKDLHNPLDLLNMEESAKRIVSAIKDNKRIAIYGDYDTDGVCSATVLSTAFKRFGFDNFDVFIPNRYKDGYGLTNLRVKQMADEGVELVITVDCGITDIEEIKLAKKLGMDVLVFDHHVPKDTLPNTLIVDPFQEKDNYPFKSLSATGIVYKLIKVLSDMLEFRFWESLERQVLDLVALATVADVVSILGENRVLVKYGLKQLKETSNIGLKALLKNSNIGNLFSYTSWHLGFILAPKLNATGRVVHKSPGGKLESVDYSFALLNSENEQEAEMWTKRVIALNEERKKQTKQIFDEVIKIIEEKNDLDRIIFLGNEKWPKGLLGLIASKIVDKWNRPAFIYNKGKEISVGSVRSIPSLDVNDLMNRAGNILIEWLVSSISKMKILKNSKIS
jgi:single-stranded-DNA-specific exonuclease